MALLSVRDRKIIFDHVIRQWCCGACVFLYVVFFLCVSSSGVRDHSRSRCRFYLVYVVFCVVHSHALAQRTESARESGEPPARPLFGQYYDLCGALTSRRHWSAR